MMRHYMYISGPGSGNTVPMCTIYAFNGMSSIFCHSIKPAEIVQSCEHNQSDSSRVSNRFYRIPGVAIANLSIANASDVAAYHFHR